jgi:hypothetical protein
MYEEAYTHLGAFTVTVGACSTANFLALLRGGLSHPAKVLARLDVGCAVYDSSVIVRILCYETIHLTAIGKDDREVWQVS